MKLPDNEPLEAEDYWTVTDTWKQEWERGVQVEDKYKIQIQNTNTKYKIQNTAFEGSFIRVCVSGRDEKIQGVSVGGHNGPDHNPGNDPHESPLCENLITFKLLAM